MSVLESEPMTRTAPDHIRELFRQAEKLQKKGK